MVNIMIPAFEISAIYLIMIILISVWDGVWKLIALWKAATKRSLAWFIILAVINSAGILPILYIFVFSKSGKKKIEEEQIKKK